MSSDNTITVKCKLCQIESLMPLPVDKTKISVFEYINICDDCWYLRKYIRDKLFDNEKFYKNFNLKVTYQIEKNQDQEMHIHHTDLVEVVVLPLLKEITADDYGNDNMLYYNKRYFGLYEHTDYLYGDNGRIISAEIVPAKYILS